MDIPGHGSAVVAVDSGSSSSVAFIPSARETDARITHTLKKLVLKYAAIARAGARAIAIMAIAILLAIQV